MAVEFRRMQSLRGASADWAAHNITMLIGELGVEFAAGRVRLKAGDGVNAWSILPYIGEQDDVARASVLDLASRVTTVETRMTAAEVITAQVPPLQQQVGTLVTVVNGKQNAFPIGSAPGDLITWNGSQWAPIAVGAIGGSILQFDAVGGRYTAVPNGAPGYVLTTSPAGTPAWLPNTSVTVRTITIAGTGTVQDDFNTARPTVQAGELVIVTHNNTAFVYSGPPGANINNATSQMFTAIGASTHFAEMPDFTSPPGGATDRAVSPALLNVWAPGLTLDAGTY